MATQYGNTSIANEKNPFGGSNSTLTEGQYEGAKDVGKGGNSFSSEIDSSEIEDEENPVPTSYQGNINFTRTIYSRRDFNSKVDSSFTELSTKEPSVSVERFFELYNEIFFEIPKYGENSHSSIIEISQDYVNDYVNPLQYVVDNNLTVIKSLEDEKRRLEEELQRLLIGDEGSLEDEIENQAAIAAFEAIVAEVGDYDNPNIERNRIKQALDELGSLGETENTTGQFDSADGPYKDLKQAYEKAKATNLKYVAVRTRDQWKADIDKSSSGKDQRDLFKACDREAGKQQARWNDAKAAING